MPNPIDDVRAAYGAILAAKAALEHVMDRADQPAPGTPVADTTGCRHANRQPAGAFGGVGMRDFCSDCQSFIYPDGRVEPAES